METIVIDHDIKIFYVTADTFPEGILDAHKKLHALVPFSQKRKYFGVSRPEKNGKIVYRAAAEELEKGEAEKFGCESLILKKGKYICEPVEDFIKYPQSIDLTFQKLLADPDIDPEGYCVEWYLTEHRVKCMVRLKN
jgi:hypothetical protein